MCYQEVKAKTRTLTLFSAFLILSNRRPLHSFTFSLRTSYSGHQKWPSIVIHFSSLAQVLPSLWSLSWGTLHDSPLPGTFLRVNNWCHVVWLLFMYCRTQLSIVSHVFNIFIVCPYRRIICSIFFVFLTLLISLRYSIIDSINACGIN